MVEDRVMNKLQSINFICNPVFTYDKTGWSPHDTFLAGTEKSIREWSWRIKEKGFDVAVYYNGEHTMYGGVPYFHYDDYEPADVEINVKHLDFQHADKRKVWYLTNETDIVYKARELDEFAGVILPTKWAMDNLGFEGNIRILPHGYDDKAIYPGKKIKNQCLYSSSPDRGLYDLLEMWTDIVEKVPDATLIVTYNAGEYNIPNTMFLGQVDDTMMSELYRTSEFWLYPCNGGELFCIAAVEAQVAGAIPVYYPTMALSETVRRGVRCRPDNYVDKCVDIMTDTRNQKAIRYALAAEEFCTWNDTTDKLLRYIGAI